VSRKYVIIDSDFVPSVVFSQVLETSADTLRWNDDESKTFVKYEGSKPSFLSGKTAITHSQILAELAQDEWIGDPPWE
jgi:hypothetical protein